MGLGCKAVTEDTIAAISTPLGRGGIGIVRISGRDALKIANRIFNSSSGLKPSSFKTHTIHYGTIMEGGKVIDEVLLTVMRSPKTYTKEDIVEINCHAGLIVLRDILSLVLNSGARLAEPGEFTKRAFLSGRIDLTQAQAVMDIISAKNDSALRVGVEQLKGNLSNRINSCRQLLLDALSALEAAIDFPEDVNILPGLKQVKKKNEEAGLILAELSQSAKFGKLLREGLRLAICGSPNVGKSSLLNALLKEERSIVTPIAGTTRDTIEEIVDIKGIPVRLIDTAGILYPRDVIERKAVERSRKEIEKADIVLFIFDGSKKISRRDLLLAGKIKRKKSIGIINKIDLGQKADRAKILKIFKDCVEISAKKAKNIGILEDKIAELAVKGIDYELESAVIVNLRHAELIRKAQKNIAQAVNSIDNSLSPELIAEDIRLALELLDELLGKSFSVDLLDKIFGEFCIGK